MQIGRRIYYDNSGAVLFDIGERSGNVIELTVEQEIAAYPQLSDLDLEVVNVIELEYGEYAELFETGLNYSVDPINKTLVFDNQDGSA